MNIENKPIEVPAGTPFKILSIEEIVMRVSKFDDVKISDLKKCLGSEIERGEEWAKEQLIFLNSILETIEEAAHRDALVKHLSGESNKDQQ